MQRTTPSDAIAPVTGQALHLRGLTGRGVGIAVIDSGVTAPAAFGERLVVGPDFTSDGATGDEGRDRTGHGTHLAGLAAGARTGVAPGAHVVSLKVAGEGGATDPMAVIAAIDWAVANRRQLQLGVVLLAFGADQFESGRDPLADAVARASEAGLFVVVSAGNAGDAPLPTPAHASEAFTVGAAEESDAGWRRCDFTTTGRGTGADLLAAGRSLVSSLALGSEAAAAPASSFVGPELVKGTGSSQAAAVVAGAAALLLEADGGLTPGELGTILRSSGQRVDDGRVLDLEAALACLASGLFRSTAGLGRVEAPAWTGLEWSGMRWTGMRWTGLEWSGMRWTGMRWTGLEWSGMRWTGMRWTGLEWSGMRWTGMRWTGLEWSGMRWTGMRWTGLEWSGMRWTGLEWS